MNMLEALRLAANTGVAVRPVCRRNDHVKIIWRREGQANYGWRYLPGMTMVLLPIPEVLFGEWEVVPPSPEPHKERP